MSLPVFMETIMMKTMCSAVVLGLALTGCGGGGDVPAPSTLPVPVTPGPMPQPGPVSAPPLDPRASTLSSPSINLAVSNSLLVVLYAGTSNLDLSGSNDMAWISEGQAMHRIAIHGTANTLVMLPGATVVTLSADAGNTVYLPQGSPIVVDGTGATVKYYR